MNEKIKMTKKDYFKLIEEIIFNSNHELKNELIYFIENQIASIDKKAEGAKIRAEKKKTANDDLRNKIQEIITKATAANINLTLDDLYEALDKIYSKQKIVSRLTQLINLDIIQKIPNNSGKKVIMTYTLK